jgi:hypothetical protein
MAIRVSNITVIDDSRNIVNVDNIGIGTTGSSGTLQIGAGTSAFVVTDVGSVGIGTTNPITQLHLSGFSTTNSNLKIGSLEFQNYSLNNSFFGDNVYWDGFQMVRRSDGTAGLFYFIGAEGQFRLSPVGLANSAAANSPQFKINSNGGFGIGSSLSQGANNFTGANFYVNPQGIVLVGTISSTGTASQKLQVTGGAYVSDSVGIGTTNPTVELQLSPNATISNVGFGITLPGTVGSALTVAQFVHSNANASRFRIKATRNATGSDWTTASTKLVNVVDVTEQAYIEFNPLGSQSGGATGLAFGTGPTEWARFLSSGNLGIGTTNPTQKLQVYDGSANVYKPTGEVNIQLESGDTSVAAFRAVSPYRNWRFGIQGGANADFVIRDATSFANRLGITSAGEVIIGSNATPLVPTGTASQNLQVTGGAYVSDSVGIGTTNPQVKLDVVGGSMRIISTSYPAATYGTNVGRIQFGYQDAFDGAELSATTNAGAGKKLYLNATGNGPVLVNTFTETGTASQPLQVSGGAYVSGSVGIGTTNPTVKLQVSGGDVVIDRGSSTTSLGRNLTIGGARNGVGANFTNLNFSNYDSGGGAVDYNAVRLRCFTPSSGQNGGLLTIETSPGGSTTAVERVRVFDTGEVGINTTVVTGTASQRLQVTGGAYVSGSVGIGTTNPVARLNLYDTAGSAAWRFRIGTNVSDGAGFYQRANGDFEMVLRDASNNNNYILGSSGNISLRPTSNVLINTDTPTGTASQPLQVNGGAYVSGSVGIGSTIPTATLTIATVGIASDGKSQIYLNGATSNRIDFNANGSAAPAAVGALGTTRSAGTKIVLYPGAGGSQVDYGFGIESSTLWSSSGGSFKWYGGTVGIATLSNTGNLSITGGISGTTGTFSSQIQSTQANNTATGGGQIYLNGAAGNRIDFSAAGVAAPAFTTRSAGTRIVLTPAVDASNVDYGFGIESSALWSSVQSASASFKWYAGTVGIATIGGNGTLSLTNAITATAADFTGVGIASDGNAQIYLNGATSNRIDFNTNGGGAPTIVGTSGTTRSAGTKIVLYPTTTIDYAFGIEGAHSWSSIPSSATGWKWYGGAVGVATLGVAGGLTLSGGLTVGTNSNIVGDFSNATLTARTYFISKTTNGFTAVGAIPNGTSTTSALYAFNNSTPTNASYCGPAIDTTGAYLRSSRTGTGAFLPLYIETTETTRVAITTTGNVGIGITNPGSSLQVAGPSAGVRITNNTGLVGDLSSTGWLISQESSISAIPPASALTISNGSVTALTALTTGSVGINTTDAGRELDVQGNISIRDTTGSATFTNPGNLSIKDTQSNPYISFHAADGARQSFIQSTDSTGFFIVEEDALPLVLRTELTSPIQFETNTTRRVAISTGGETEFFKGISVVAGIATIPTVSVTATTASTSTTTGALIVAGGVGVAASVHVGGDVDYRRSAATVLTATYTGTPANIAAISAVGNIGVVTFATAGIAATMNVTGMLPGQVLELFVTNPTTAKVLTIQYNGTAIAGVGIASASPAQGASFAANGTRLYRFIAATNNPAVVAGDIKVVGTA